MTAAAASMIAHSASNMLHIRPPEIVGNARCRHRVQRSEGVAAARYRPIPAWKAAGQSLLSIAAS